MLAVLSLLAWGAHMAAEEEPQPRPEILSIRLDGAELVVEVRVPAEIRQVTLESRGRLLEGSWIPRRVVRTSGEEETVSLRIERDRDMEMLRVRGEVQPGLPGIFFQGPTSFSGPVQSWQNRMFPGFAEDGAVPVSEDTSSGREVVESDIYRISGDRLYFFNQYLGLQLLDISDPDLPVLLQNLRLPASGEQMYLLDSGHAALLVRDTCHYYGGGAESRVVLVDTRGDALSTVATVPVQGRILESRMVGSALYLAAQTYRPVEDFDEEGNLVVERWDWGTLVSSHDLSDPSSPARRDEIWVPGSGHVIHATSERLFVSTLGSFSRWRRSRIEVFDISDPDGSIRKLSSIAPAGRVADKFKMNLDGDVFTVISEVNADVRTTLLENWDLSVPGRSRLMGSVEVGRNESLFATRFDGDKAYIVTYLRIDPLWVVDLTDPYEPTISGELEVPGWSTYIQPLGDRLLSIGIDDTEGFRVAVSLFDVADPSQPGLLSRVSLGESHSWSEANHDEKALGFLPDAGLILVPFSSWEGGQNATGVQLVEMAGDDLHLRGLIEDQVTPRRTAQHRDRILSLSGKNLITVDATDLDAPEVTGSFALSWSVDRIFELSDHLVEIAQGSSWTSETPSVRVVSASDPDTVLARLDLGSLPVIGASLEEDRLLLVQADDSGGWFWPEGGDDASEDEASIRLTVLDLSDPPSISVELASDHLLEGSSGFSSAGLHLVGEGALAVSLDGYASHFRGGPWIDVFWPWGGGHRRLLAFELEEGSLLSDLSLGEEGNSWDASPIFQEGTLLYMSYREQHVLPPPEPLSPEPHPEQWMEQYFLHVVDYADPENPVRRDKVNIPGSLAGIGRQGALLYTLAPHWDPDTGETDWAPWLDASAYDGVSAHLVDSLKLANQWRPAVHARDDLVYVGQAAGRDGTGSSTDALSLYRITDQAVWQRLDSFPLPSAPASLAVRDSLLVAVSSNEYWFFDRSSMDSLSFLGVAEPLVCYGARLEFADGSARTGLWLPIGDYGLSHLIPARDGSRVSSVQWGEDLGDGCGKGCYLRMEIGSSGVELVDEDPSRNAYLNLDPEIWRELVDLLDTELLSRMEDSLECPGCESGPREWLRVITHAGVAQLAWPGAEQGPSLPQGGDGLERLVEILDGLLGKFRYPEHEPVP